MSLEGKKAPKFNLPDQRGKIHKLSDYKGGKLLLYFYPKDMTPGCTVESEVFRDMKKKFEKVGVVVVGVSADSVKRHDTFCKKHKINFTLLSDEKKNVLKKYGVWVEKSMYGKKYMGIQRDSFLIDEYGIVIKHYEKVNPAEHAKEVLKEITG